MQGRRSASLALKEAQKRLDGRRRARVEMQVGDEQVAHEQDSREFLKKDVGLFDNALSVLVFSPT